MQHVAQRGRAGRAGSASRCARRIARASAKKRCATRNTSSTCAASMRLSAEVARRSAGRVSAGTDADRRHGSDRIRRRRDAAEVDRFLSQAAQRHDDLQTGLILMKRLKAAMFGTGFMGKVHTEALRRLGNVDVAAVAASSQATADKFAEALMIPKATGDWRSVLADSTIDAVHICTPNSLHHRDGESRARSGQGSVVRETSHHECGRGARAGRTGDKEKPRELRESQSALLSAGAADSAA